jgi:hypothetical protein
VFISCSAENCSTVVCSTPALISSVMAPSNES